MSDVLIVLLYLPFSRRGATMANIFEGFLRVTSHSFSYSFGSIELFWYLMERAGRALFLNLVYFGPQRSAVIVAIPI